MLTPARWTPYRETQTVYNSIKLLTVMNRFLSSDGSLTFADLSSRRNGQLIKQLDVFPRPGSTSPNALRSAADGTWKIEYTTRSNTGSLVEIDGKNALMPTWQLDPGTQTNSVKISAQRTRLEDGLPVTDLTESVRNDPVSIAKFGKNSVDIEVSAGPLEPADLDAIAATWYRPEAGWNINEIEIHDSDQLSNSEIRRLLATRYRSRTLIIISRVLVKQPDPSAASNIRAALLGGKYTWTGEKWQLILTLGRNQTFAAEDQYSFADIANHYDANISQGTANTIGRAVSFADFKQISRSAQ